MAVRDTRSMTPSEDVGPLSFLGEILGGSSCFLCFIDRKSAAANTGVPSGRVIISQPQHSIPCPPLAIIRDHAPSRHSAVHVQSQAMDRVVPASSRVLKPPYSTHPLDEGVPVIPWSEPAARSLSPLDRRAHPPIERRVLDNDVIAASVEKANAIPANLAWPVPCGPTVRVTC